MVLIRQGVELKEPLHPSSDPVDVMRHCLLVKTQLPLKFNVAEMFETPLKAIPVV